MGGSSHERGARSFQNKLLTILGFLVFAAGSLVFADQPPIIYGLEIELTNYEINVESDKIGGEEVYEKTAVRYQRALVQRIQELCPDCTVESFRARYGITALKVTIPHLDNYTMTVNLDPGTVEIQMKPATFEEFRKYAPELQRLIYEAGKSVGLYPVYEGAGHIHVSVARAFGKDVQRFRNFLVDYVNHSELATGVFEYEHSNAPPLTALGKERYEAFKKIIEDFDQNPRRYTIKELATRIVKEVYTTNPEKWLPYPKYQALSLNRIVNDKYSPDQWTVEIRAVRAPSDFKETLLFIELFERRIRFLEGYTRLIPLRERALSPQLSESRAARYFKEFIEEMRLSWNKYKKILMSRDPTPNPSVEDKGFFKKLRCSSVLQ